MPIPGDLLTTAMAVMPHTDVSRALDVALGLDMDILSLDVYLNGEIFSAYAGGIRKFLDRGGIIVWGIVSANVEPFEQENIDTLEKRLINLWDVLDSKGIDREFLLSRSLISPATRCLVNPDGEATVETAFNVVNNLSARLREKYRLM